MTFVISLPRLTRPCWDERWKKGVLASADFIFLSDSSYYCCRWNEVHANEVNSQSRGWLTYLVNEWSPLIVNRVSQFNKWTPSASFTTNPWWNSTFIRSFHSSVFSPWRALPQCRTLYIPPLHHVWTQKDVWLVWATHSFVWWVRWAESGGLTWCELKWPSFGCLKLWTSRWVPSFHIIIADWLTKQIKWKFWLLFLKVGLTYKRMNESW
jgi:hypothetical protein